MQKFYAVIDTNVNINSNIKDINFKPMKIEEKNDVFYDYYVRYFNGQYDEITFDVGEATELSVAFSGRAMVNEIVFVL